MSKPLAYEQTSQGWDNVAQVYGDMVEETGFTGVYCVDALDKTIPLGSVPKDLKILDIATGSGGLSIPAAVRVKDHNGSVLATDFSPEMIRVLKQTVDKKYNDLPIEAKVMDGQALELPDNQFDFVYSIFGAIFFPDFQKGFSEIYRVAKQGGKAVITAWAPYRTPSTEMIMETLKRLAKAEGIDTLSNPNKEQPSYMYLSNPEVFKSVLLDAGFKTVTITPVSLSFNTSIDKFVAFIDTNPVTINMKGKLPGSLSTKFNEAFRSLMFERFPDGIAVVDSTAYIAIAEK